MVDFSLGKLLVILGVLLFGAGILLLWGGGVFPRLPGDLSFRIGEGGRVWIPLGTSIVLSIVLTVLLNLLARRG